MGFESLSNTDRGADREAFGSANVELVSQMLESFALMPFTRVLRKSLEECKQMVQDARAELELPNARIYNRLYVECEESCGMSADRVKILCDRTKS